MSRDQESLGCMAPRGTLKQRRSNFCYARKRRSGECTRRPTPSTPITPKPLWVEQLPQWMELPRQAVPAASGKTQQTIEARSLMDLLS